MPSEYLKTLNDKIASDSSQVKLLIQDIPKISELLIFSNLKTPNEIEMLCNVLRTLLLRISISARRSKQAFTSMWDNLRKYLEIILNDALKIESRCRNTNMILRQILQLGIKPKGTILYCDCNWLAMDLDVQVGKLMYSNGIGHVNNLEDDLNLKTISLYCEKFQVPDFSKLFLKISTPSFSLIELFFKKYYSHQIISEIILSRDVIPVGIIINLKNLSSNELIKFPCNIIKLLITKILPIRSENSKEQSSVFELLTEISMSIDYRSDSILDSTLTEIINNYYFSFLNNDTVLSKYWSFVSSILSSEHFKSIFFSSLEEKIIYTLQAESMIKSKVSVCRVVSLYWSKINDKPGVFELLLKCIQNCYASNKLKWNVAITLMTYNCSDSEFSRAKLFWLKEIHDASNFKVMFSWTNLLLKWSIMYQYELLSDADDQNIIWNCLNHLKKFLGVNSLNLEYEDDENIVEIANKLETLLKSILIGPNSKGD